MVKEVSKSVFVGLVSILFVLGVLATSTLALEGKAGEVIKTLEDLKSLEEKGLITHGQATIYGQLIKDFGKEIPIVKTTDRRQEVAVSKSFVKVTQANKGKASVDAEDNLVNYAGAGLPFPDLTSEDPQAGIKGAWNYEVRHAGDDFNEKDWQYYLTDAKGNIKHLWGDWLRITDNRRTDIPPVPSLNPSSPSDIWYKEITSFSGPFASKGLAQMAVKYVEAGKDRDIYVYVPGLRRTTRVGGGNRCDSLGGFTFNMDDSNAWSGDTAKFKWKLLAVKEHLVSSLKPFDEVKALKTYVRGAHDVWSRLERRKMWMIEQTPKSSYCYSKRIFFLDPESWWFLWEEMYDQGGKLWKALAQGYDIFPNPESTGGGNLIINVDGTCVDLKIWEGGPYHHTHIETNININPGMFTLDAMRRAGR